MSREELAQTSNPNKERYIMSSNLDTDAMPKSWIEMWQQVEIWYGDPLKRETAERMLNRIMPPLFESHQKQIADLTAKLKAAEEIIERYDKNQNQ